MLTSRAHQLQHNKVHQLLPNLTYEINKYLTSKMLQISSSLHLHKLTVNHRKLHHRSLLHQHCNCFNSLLLYTSNSSCCDSHQFQAHMLHTSSRVSCNLCNLELALKANPSGNQGNHKHVGNLLFLLHSLSFQLQWHNKIQSPILRSLES